MTVVERIAKCRKNKNLSQEYVADQLGISRQSVSKWEKNITYPDTNNLIALAELLDTTVEYIACGKEPTTECSTPTTESNPTNLYKIIGIVLLVLGLVSLVLGLALPKLSELAGLGGLLIGFGVLFACWDKLGMYISVIITLLTTILICTVGTIDIDIAMMILASACYISLLCALVSVVVVLVRKRK